METWKGTVRRAREIEGLLEARLPELKNPKDVEAALVELRSCVDAMASIVQQAPTTANAAVLQRYTEALSDFEAEFKRSSARAREQRDRENLFRGADTSDIEGGGRDDPNADLDPLVRERKSVQGATRGVADAMAQGLEAKEALARQRATLSGSTLSLSGMVNALPSVNDVITAMHKQQTRHNAIIGTTMGCCACFLIWAVFLST